MNSQSMADGPSPFYDQRHNGEPHWCYDMRMELVAGIDAERAKVTELAANLEAIGGLRMAALDRAEAAEAKVARLREAIERAPHGLGCTFSPGSFANNVAERPCNCWKAEALKEAS